ncbi:hypothetical protein E3N88_00202 [Mikania micrantha]|uniref:Uncharacterized protein n=1 Tax=Mikania micrantha TaxID=192012 RepID=A0A5N6PZ63_9ASTR|nr:hypothetical protein E3N88_00202 [Mikania micrantha]
MTTLPFGRGDRPTEWCVRRWSSSGGRAPAGEGSNRWWGAISLFHFCTESKRKSLGMPTVKPSIIYSYWILNMSIIHGLKCPSPGFLANQTALRTAAEHLQNSHLFAKEGFL